MTSSNNPSNVTRLIDKRQIFTSEISNAIQKLSALSYNLAGLATSYTRNSFVEDSTFEIDIENINHIIQEIENEQQQLFKLKERFGKKNVSIGVLGLARQGKSTLLQSLSGLNAKIIPGGNGLHCTGATTLITNSESEIIDVIVKFHTRENFFNNMIRPYYTELEITPVPKNLAEFEVSVLPEYTETNPSDAAKYKKLHELHNNLSKYNYLLTGISKHISTEEIAEYVTQYDTNRNPIFKYLAVEQVDVMCPFPGNNAGSITLIDMPGIGDVGNVDEAKKIAELVAKVDFLVFVRKPDPLGDAWGSVDLDLYKKCNTQITELGIPGVSLKDNSFLILNRVNFNTEVNNIRNCQDMLAGAADHGMVFSEISIVDCINKTEVFEKILGNISSSFINRIHLLDDKMMTHSQSNMLSLFSRARDFISDLEKYEISENDMDLYLFKTLFNNLWNVQINAFENLLKEKYSLRNEPNTMTYEHFTRTREHVELRLKKLTEADINSSRNALGSYNKAYEDYLNEYKTIITNEFFKLDKILLEVLTTVKDEVYAILKNEGKLAYIGSADEDGFDSALLEEVDNINELKNTISSFKNFQLSYLGFLHFKIREYLDILTPDYLEIRLSREDSAADILRYIRYSVEACLYQIQKEFHKWSQDINKILFSLLEEFLNQIFRSKHAKDNWEIFYQLNRFKVWSERYGATEAKQNQYAKFKLYIETTKTVTNEHYLNTYE